MKVAVYYNNNDIRIEQRPKPQITDGEILVEVKASGICGTDVMEWYRIQKAPRVLGHEIAGIIAESKSPKYHTGQPVFVSHHVPCNNCKYCLAGDHTACETLHQGSYDPGGYSEFVRVPRINAERGTYLLPDNISFIEATMVEPLACAIRGLRVIGVEKNHTVLVLGCGVSGLLNIVLSKLKGAKVIAADINDYRINKAREFGADEVLNATRAINVKAERVIICTGAQQAVKQAFSCIDRKGVILLFAIPQANIELPNADFWRNELSIASSYGAAPLDLEEALSLIKEAKADVKKMITHQLPFEEIQRGFKLVAGAGESLKAVLVL